MIPMGKKKGTKRNRNNIRGDSTRDKNIEYFENKLSVNKNTDVRYWRSIKDLKEMISYPFACNQDRCPLMKHRLDLHTRQHHPDSLADALSISPKPKTVRNSKCNSSSSTQTFTLQDQSEGTENEPAVNRYVLQGPNLYKLELGTIVMKWVQFVPIYPYTSDKKVVDNAINLLVTNINNLANSIKNMNYEESVKIEIDHFLNIHGMWHPNINENDKYRMKDSLINYLWQSITDINDKHFVNNIGDEDITIYNYDNNYENQASFIYSQHNNWDVRFSTNESQDGIEKEIRIWLNELRQSHKVNNVSLNKKETVQYFLTRLTDLLDQQRNTTCHKSILKREIVEILYELQICSYYPNRDMDNMDIDIFAESLTNKLVNLQTKYNSCNIENQSSSPEINKSNNIQILNIPNGLSKNNGLNHTLLEMASECLENKDNNICSNIVEDTTDIIVKNLDCFRIKKDNVVNAEISDLLCRSCDVSLDEASDIAQQIVDIANEIVSQDDTVVSSTNFVRPCLSGVISVYATADSTKPSTSLPIATSTPKKKLQKLNPEERSYGDKLKNLIQAWMSTLPEQFHTPEDKVLKETIIYELVTNIVDEAKIGQVIPQYSIEQRRYLSFLIDVWLQKFNLCTDFDASTGQKNLLIEKILTIPVPILIRSQYGTRQEMENLRHAVDSADPIIFVPNATDILEDEISMWMNEQPSDIYATNNKSIRGRMVQELASKVRTPLANKRPKKEITQEVAQWLTKIVKPVMKNNVKQLSENLKDRIVKLPQDQTLAEKKDQYRHMFHEKIKETLLGPAPPEQPSTSASQPTVHETEKTLMEFIGRYIEHNYEIDDPLARGAFTQLLKTEIIRHNPPTRKEVYDNFMKSGQRDYFSTERLDKELQYIQILTDWLKTVPLLPNSIVSNAFRLELINTLAKDIYEIEDRRVKAPDEMDHDIYLKSVVLIQLYELPLDRPIYINISDQLFDELKSKIVATRPTNQFQTCCKASAINTKKIYRKEEIGNFIEDYVQENSRLLNGDEVKMKACSARLLEEVKQIVQETADPELLSKEKVYENLNEVPVSGDESVRRFNLALDYAKEITEWMKNLPLLPILNQPEAQERSMNMISTLAEKIVGRHCKKAANPMDTQADNELVNFVKDWISELPVEPEKEIVYPIVISQLMNRIKKIDMKIEGEKTNLEKIQEKINNNINKPQNISKTKPESSNPKIKNLPPGETGEGLLVDAIEKWCDGLPINGEDDVRTKTIKDNVAKNLYQKIGDLNANPRTHHDNLLFQEMIADEIDTQLEHVPQNTVLQNNREKLKKTLLEEVMEAKQIMKETSAGDNYRHKLEKTIESAIPYPVKNLNRDPAFEIYKNRLAEAFILENFDHGNDAVKINYEKRIKNEIDKYFQSAQKRNAIPLSKDQIYNELYSSLFKVPIPNENSIVEEVEEVKTKCELEKWFQQLPLRPADGVRELLEWNKILSMLAKRINEIEKSESEPDEKIHKEITKWLLQLPLLPEQRGNVDKLANNLQAILKTTVKSRKFVPIPSGEPVIKSKSNMDRVSKSRAGGVSQREWPSRAGRKWVSSSNGSGLSPCQVPPTPRQRNSAEIIHMLIIRWCDKLPIRGNTIEEQVEACSLLDDLKSRIMLKISELNSSLAILNDDILYNELFDDALEALLSTLPPNSQLQETKERRKFILIQEIQQVRPLIIEEKARQEYKKDLNETVSDILGGPHSTTTNMAAMFDKIKEEIIEHFLEYYYNKDDEEGKHAYKMLLHDAIVKYFTEIAETWDSPSDVLMKRNELICELSKIPIPSTAVLKQEVEEIRMKNEVRDFFNVLSLPEESGENMALRDQVKNNLAKMLNDIEKSGHNSSNDNKMKEEISRCLQKLNIQVDPEVINAFVTKLKNDESERKAPPPRKESERAPSPCQAVQATGPLYGQASGVLQASSIPVELNPCLSVQTNVPIGAFPVIPSNSRCADGNYPGSCAGVVLNSSVGQPCGVTQQIPVVADGSVHRSILRTSVLQPAQVPVNEMVLQTTPCQLPVPCPQAIPQVLPQDTPRVHLLSTVQASSVNQRTGTATTARFYERQRQAMAQAAEPDTERDTGPEAARPRETRPGTRRHYKVRSTPSSEEDEECICESRRPRSSRNQPPCYYPRDYCEDMMPPWWEKGGRKNLKDKNIKKKIANCLKLLNIQANPDVINGYLNKLQSDQIETQDMLSRNVVVDPAMQPGPDEAIQAIVNRTVPSCGALQGCTMPVGQSPYQDVQARMSRTVPICCQASGAGQVSAMPAVQNPNQALQVNVPLGAYTAPQSNPTCAGGNCPVSNAGVVLSSSVGQLHRAAQQIPVIAGLQPDQVPANVVMPQISQNPTCQQPILQRSILVPNNIQDFPSNVPEAIPQVIPGGQLLSTVQTTSTGTPITGIYERQAMGEVPEAQKPRETRQGKSRNKASSKYGHEDRYDGRRLRGRSNRPPCYDPRDYCNDCDDMMPSWWGMVPPGYFY